jgi:pyruvate/2-oxoacid:ferredoxin oxidoreductase beta subunit
MVAAIADPAKAYVARTTVSNVRALRKTLKKSIEKC